MAEYIDITELKKQIADFKKAIHSPNGDYLTGYMCALSVTEGIIASLPTADVVEVRHGEWFPYLVYGERVWECSECRTLGSPHWKRCPLCGVKMDGGKTE